MVFLFLTFKMYKVIISSGFRKSFYKLPKPIQERVRKILENLKIYLSGEPLKGDLKNFYSVHFERNKYRLIYYKEDNVLQVLVLHVGKRTSKFYEEFRRQYLKSKK